MAHKHSIYDTDPHFIIDPITREVTNMSDTRTTVVIQGDHNSERFTFELPRYVEGHDMLECNKIQVHYINLDTLTKEKSTGVYEPTDFQESPDDPEVVICSWPISLNATKYVGSLTFVVRFACMTGEEIDYAWNSAICTGVTVSSGIDNSGAVVEQYADILEAWKEELRSNVWLGLEQTKYGADNNGVNIWTAYFGDGSAHHFEVHDGVDGKTPIKGTDYWTPEEQAAIRDQNIRTIAHEVASRCRFRIEFVDSVDKCKDIRAVYVLTPDMYMYTFVGVMDFPAITYHEERNMTYTMDGELESYAGHSCKYTNLIPVHEGDQFVYTGCSTKGVKQCPAVLFYDGNEEFIDTTAFGERPPVGGSDSTVRTDTFTVPAGVSFVRFHSQTEGYPSAVTLEVSWVVRGTWENSGIKFTPEAVLPEVDAPTKLSELENDCGFITSAAVPKRLSELEADSISGYELSIGASALNISGGSIHINKADYGFYVDGNRIQSVGTPENSADAANKGYVDGLVGDVESALDSILALQNSLIGGDAI